MNMIVLEKTVVEAIAQQLQSDDPTHIRAGYLTGSVSGDTIVVDGIYVPKQFSTSSTSSITEEMPVTFQTVRSQQKTIVGFAQYNGNCAVFESAMAHKNRNHLASLGVPNLALVVNVRNEYKTFSE